jgi:hypothetical protein
MIWDNCGSWAGLHLIHIPFFVFSVESLARSQRSGCHVQEQKSRSCHIYAHLNTGCILTHSLVCTLVTWVTSSIFYSCTPLPVLPRWIHSKFPIKCLQTHSHIWLKKRCPAACIDGSATSRQSYYFRYLTRNSPIVGCRNPMAPTPIFCDNFVCTVQTLYCIL